jgi:hypothetical protein
MTRIPFATGLIAIVACFGLRAQSGDLRANIPFDFRIGDSPMPAGEYDLHYERGLLVVSQHSGGNKSVATFPSHSIRMQPHKKGELLFNRYGDSYFFQQAWAPGSREGLQLLQGSLEKRIAKSMEHASPAEETISTK